MSNKVTFAQAVATGLKGYFKFRGTSTRPQYWYFVLFVFLVNVVVSTFDSMISVGAGITLPITLSALASYLFVFPQLTTQVRRFRDAGVNPWLQTLQLIPVTLLTSGAFIFVANNGMAALEELDSIADPTLADVQHFMDQLPPTAVGLLGFGGLLAIIWGLFAFIVSLMPSKSRAHGNKYAPEQ